MRPRRLASSALLAAALVVGTAPPASAAISWSYFNCDVNQVQTSAPRYDFESSTTTIWWIPEYFRWDGQSWVQHAYGEWHYNNEAGAPHAWYQYPSNTQGGNQALTASSGYYAVRNWVHAEGRWHSAWAENADPNTGPQPESTYWCRS